MALLSTKTGLPSFSAQDNAIVNYFTDGGFERGSNGVIPSGWSQYNDGAVAVPVDGTGGAAVAQVTMLVTNSSPIRGTLSAVISKDANNRQGVGYSFPFTISNADKGITAGVNFELVTSANYVSGDMVFYIYDVTNSIVITPRSVSLPALTNYGKFFSDYGLTAGTSYRFILHIATTSALAYTVTLDTMVNTTTRVAVPGTINTNWVTYTPTLGASLTGSVNTARWRQINDSIEIMGAITASNTGASAVFSVSIPSGYTILSTAMARATGQIQEIGKGRFYNAATTDLLDPYVLSSTTIAFVRRGTNNSDLNGNAILSGYTIDYRFTVPISEFSGSGSNFGPGASVEYLSTDFASFSAVRSSGGTALPTTTPAGTNEQIDMGALPWQNAQQSIDMVDIEIQQAGAGPWLPLPNADIAILTFDGTNYIGLGILYTGGTYKMIRGKYRAAGAGTWASIAAGTRYRVLKARPDSPVGQALATSLREGLIPKFSEGTYSFTPTSQTNLDASIGSITANYVQTGNNVTVYGTIAIDISAGSVATSFEVALPVASSLTNSYDIAGICTANNGNTAQLTWTIKRGTVITTGAKFEIGQSTGSGSLTYNYTFTYKIN